MWPEMGREFQVFTLSFPMHQGSKLRNWIAQLIFNQFLWTKFALKAMNQGLQTSPRTSKCGQKWVENSKCSPHPSLCIKAQNSEIEFQDQYSTNFHDLSLPLNLWIRAFRRAQECPTVARNEYRMQGVHFTLLYASSLKTPKLNCKTNTQSIFMI